MDTLATWLKESLQRTLAPSVTTMNARPDTTRAGGVHAGSQFKGTVYQGREGPTSKTHNSSKLGHRSWSLLFYSHLEVWTRKQRLGRRWDLLETSRPAPQWATAPVRSYFLKVTLSPTIGQSAGDRVHKYMCLWGTFHVHMITHRLPLERVRVALVRGECAELDHGSHWLPNRKKQFSAK